MAIDLAVDKFYAKVLSDPALKDFFKSVDMKH
jgi:truncated hemoglobin YjbI